MDGILFGGNEMYQKNQKRERRETGEKGEGKGRVRRRRL
jgi:hypothetical protein